LAGACFKAPYGTLENSLQYPSSQYSTPLPSPGYLRFIFLLYVTIPFLLLSFPKFSGESAFFCHKTIQKQAKNDSKVTGVM
jgi:hypothetical protein